MTQYQWTQLKSNLELKLAGALAVIATIAAYFLSESGGSAGALFGGAILGAAVSSLYSVISKFINDPFARELPYPLVRAASRDVVDVGFYREHQTITIDIDGPNEAEQVEITITFDAQLVPTGLREAKIRRPQKIVPPIGFDLADNGISHQIDAENVPTADGSFKKIDKRSREILTIKYKSNADFSNNEIEDDHIWLSSVLSYSVFIRGSCISDSEVIELYGDERQSLSYGHNIKNNEFTHSSSGAAFSRQGIEWKISLI